MVGTGHILGRRGGGSREERGEGSKKIREEAGLHAGTESCESRVEDGVRRQRLCPRERKSPRGLQC